MTNKNIKTHTTQIAIEFQDMELIDIFRKHRVDSKCDLTDDIISNLPILEFSYRVHDLLIPELSIEVLQEGYVKYINNTTKEILGRSDRKSDLTYDEIKKIYLDKLQDDRDITVLRFTKEYLAGEIGILKASTIADYKAYIRKYIVTQLGSKRIKDLRMIDIERLHRSLASTPYQANRVLAVVSKMISYAKRLEIYERENPCRYVKKFPEKARSRSLSKDEIAKLGRVLNSMAITDQHRMHNLMIYFLLQTGSRFSEMVFLKKSQIKNGNIHWEDTKTVVKNLPISPKIQEILDKACALNESDDNVFYQEFKTTDNSLRNYWEKVRKLAGLSDVRIHDLRHTFASISLDNGVPLENIREILNHTSIVTTQRYLHASTSSLVGAMEGISEFLVPLE